VYIQIVSVINLRVSMYSVVLQYFIYYVIIMITYLLCVCWMLLFICIIVGLAVGSEMFLVMYVLWLRY
jgi:hypothetical protein